VPTHENIANAFGQNGGRHFFYKDKV